jgi:ribosomal protein S18 acetylase RimI-like enzyme
MVAEPDRGGVHVRDLRRDEIAAAIDVLARGMRDNPLHVAAYGSDPERRRRCHARLVQGLFRTFSAQQPICAVRNGVIVGVTGVAPPGTCQPTPAQRLRLLPALVGLGAPTAVRVTRWVSAWARHDPDEPHVHLGPLAVDTHLQGQGIGTLIMLEHTRQLDAASAVGYLETDRPQNVGFYERFGYQVVGDDTVLGVANWYMRRPPQLGAPGRGVSGDRYK